MYALIILGIGCIFLPICFLFIRNNIKRNGEEVEAVVVRNVLHRGAGEPDASFARRQQRADHYLADFYAGTLKPGIMRSPGEFMPVFQYRANGLIHEATYRVATWPPRYREGDIERILYNRSNNKSIILASEETPYVGLFLLISLGLVFVAAGSLPLLFSLF